jgi:carboxymethylenebutenolidase
MGERMSFTLNGQKAQGWFAKTANPKGPAVLVIQEWWGLVPHITNVTERFAKEGFVAFAPDLYHGKTTTSPDEAGRLLMELDVERAGREIAGAGAFLLQHASCSSRKFGVVGFCMGGALAQYAATTNPNVGAAVSFYGGFKKCAISWKHLYGPLLLVYGGKDPSVPASDAGPLEEKLKAMGKEVETVVYPDAGHAFFNDSRPSVHDPIASADAWKRTLAHLRRALV